MTVDQWESCILTAVAVSPCQWVVAAAGPAELSWVTAVNELSLYTLQYSGCTVQWTVVWHPTKSFSPWSTWCLQPGFKGWADLSWARPGPAPVAADNNINQSPSHLSSARENKYILLWCCGDRLGLYFQRYFSLLIFCLNILVRKACEKWVYRV